MGFLKSVMRSNRGNQTKVRPLSSPKNIPIVTSINQCDIGKHMVCEEEDGSAGEHVVAGKREKRITRMMITVKRLVLRLMRRKKTTKEVIQATIIREMKGSMGNLVGNSEDLKEVVDPVMQYQEENLQNEYGKMLAQMNDNCKVEDLEITPDMVEAMDKFVQCCYCESGRLPYPDYLLIPEEAELEKGISVTDARLEEDLENGPRAGEKEVPYDQGANIESNEVAVPDELQQSDDAIVAMTTDLYSDRVECSQECAVVSNPQEDNEDDAEDELSLQTEIKDIDLTNTELKPIELLVDHCQPASNVEAVSSCEIKTEQLNDFEAKSFYSLVGTNLLDNKRDLARLILYYEVLNIW